MARYQIWDRNSNIYTYVGEVLTPEQWAARYPWINIPGAKMIIGGGKINGSLCEEYDSFVARAKRLGVDITDDMTDEEVLAAIEAFEDNPPPQGDVTESSAEERIAAALELANTMNMPTVNADDPDED